MLQHVKTFWTIMCIRLYDDSLGKVHRYVRWSGVHVLIGDKCKTLHNVLEFKCVTIYKCVPHVLRPLHKDAMYSIINVTLV